jgi:hypothetical protein
MTPDEIDQQKLEALRRDIQIGLEQADQGKVVPFDPLKTLDRVRQQRANRICEEK